MLLLELAPKQSGAGNIGEALVFGRLAARNAAAGQSVAR